MPRKDEPKGAPTTSSRRHSLGQRIFRDLYGFMGPAQVGPPPYATPEELEAYAREMAPVPPTRKAPPPGYHFVYYTDPNGTPRRMIAKDAAPSSDGPAEAGS